MTTSPIDGLYSHLEELLGAQHAETFMNHLATKTDLAELKEAVDDRFDKVDDRLSKADDRFDQVEERLGRVEERLGQVDRDLRQLVKRYRKFEDRIDLKLDRMHEIMHTQFRHYTIYLLGGMTVLVGLVSFLG